MRDFTAYPPYECRINDEGEVSSLYKVGGSQRPIGLLFSDSPSREIFLGTMMFGDEKKPMDYGRDDGRDMAGYIERVGDKRWRLVLPWPKFESIVDVVELVPRGLILSRRHAEMVSVGSSPRWQMIAPGP